MAGGDRHALARLQRAPEIRDRGNEPGQRGGPGAEPARVVRRRVDGAHRRPGIGDQIDAEARHHHEGDRAQLDTANRAPLRIVGARQLATQRFFGADAPSSRQEIVRQVGDGRTVDRIERSLGTHHRQRTPALFADRRSKENIALARLDGRAGGQLVRHKLRHRRHCRGAQQRGRSQARVADIVDAREVAHAEERSPAQREKIVVEADTVVAQQLFEDRGDPRLERRARPLRLRRRCDRPLRLRGQPTPIDLSVRQAGDGRDGPDGVRNHVVGKPIAQIRRQFIRPYR